MVLKNLLLSIPFFLAAVSFAVLGNLTYGAMLNYSFRAAPVALQIFSGISGVVGAVGAMFFIYGDLNDLRRRAQQNSTNPGIKGEGHER